MMAVVDAEAQLVRRVRDGDAGALRELYDALGRNVLALAYRMTGSREDAEEVLQDTFVKVHDAAARFDPARGSVRAWIYSIARNDCRMRLRARRSRPMTADGVDVANPGVPLGAHPAGPHGTGAHPVDRMTVQQAFAALSSDEARLLEAAFFGGYSHAELAKADGVPLGTIKSRIRRAMSKARDALSPSSASPRASSPRPSRRDGAEDGAEDGTEDDGSERPS